MRSIFIKSFYLPKENQYYISPLPGKKEGISASCISGYNIIINKFISEDNKIAAGKVIDYLLSKDIQKKYIINYGKHSGMNEIYYDKELCSRIDCELFRNLQLVHRPTQFLNNYDEYSTKFRTYLYNFLYNNATTKDTLQKIEDIAFIYSISYSSILGIVISVITVLLMIVMLLSFSVICQRKNSYYLRMYDKLTWFLMLVTLCFFLSYNFVFLGELNKYKCSLYTLTPSIGIFIFCYPTLVAEIVNFPAANKYSEFIKKMKDYLLLGELHLMQFLEL